MKFSIFLLMLSVCSFISCIWASPVPSRVKYDQRQEGDLNVRADLENFVILVIPTSPGASSSSMGLLDLLSKAIPLRSHHGHNKRVKYAKKPQHVVPLHSETDDETQSFIESKTAPYHVDITKSKKKLAKLHPAAAQQFFENEKQEELLMSQNLALVKSDDSHVQQKRSLRVAKGFVLSMPLEVEEDVVHIDNKRIEKYKDDKDKSKDIKEEKEVKKKIELVKSKEAKPNVHKVKPLLDEKCEPGYERDETGICKFA